VGGITWNEKDKDYLRGTWGKCSLSYIAKRLNRSLIAVNSKAKRMGLGASSRADEYITACQVSVILKIDRHTVTRWIVNHNLGAIRKATLFKKEFCLIKHCTLCRWLKNNQDKFDSRRIELFGLGYEPGWLKEKRIRDKQLPVNQFKIWTNVEIQRIILYAKEMPYKKIAEIMGRSLRSIEGKMGRLRINNVYTRETI